VDALLIARLSLHASATHPYGRWLLLGLSGMFGAGIALSSAHRRRLRPSHGPPGGLPN
jgi:hypothetical protein